ncbi:MAG: response regulator [Bacteroidales bacterium]
MEHSELNKYRNQVKSLLQFGRDLSLWLNSADELLGSLQYVIDTFCSIDGIDLGGIYLLNSKNSNLELVAQHGLGDQFIAMVKVYPPESINYQQMAMGEYVFESISVLKDKFLKDIAIETDFVSVAILPLIEENKPIGCINLASKSLVVFEPELQHLLISISSQVSQLVAKFHTQAKLIQMYQAVEQSPEAIIITNIKGEIEYVNPKFCELSGYTFSEIIGKNPRIQKSGKMSSEEYKVLWNTILSGKIWKGELLNRKKNNELYWESTSISPILNNEGKISGFIGIKEDVSNKKALQEELIRAKEIAEESNKFKTALLNGLNYEFRSPLTAIMGFANLLQQSDHGYNNEMLNNIVTSGEGLIETLDSILLLAQLNDPIEFNLETLDLISVVKEVLNEFEEKLIKKEINYRFINTYNSLFVKADKRLLRLALDKILTNIIKSTDQGFIHINFDRLLKEGKNQSVLKIAATGIENLRYDSKSYHHPFLIKSPTPSGDKEMGSLGLNIALRIFRIFKGNIIFSRTEENLVEIQFILPCIDVKKNLSLFHAPDSKFANIPDLTEIILLYKNKPKVLVVEDNEMNAMLMQSMLGKIVDITVVRNGETALEQAGRSQYNLILMDINLGPGMNGMQVSLELRKQKKYYDIPIVAVTGYTLKEEKDKIYQAGLDYYLGKPFKKEELLNVVRLMLYRHFQATTS